MSTTRVLAVPTPAVAQRVAREYLSPLGTRWLHTQAVAARAEELRAAVPPADRDLLVAAAWWHDIGYAPSLAVFGFHPLDGAAFVAARGYSPRLAALIAHHSGAAYEAAERGLLERMRQWPRERGAVADALWTADMTTGPEGSRLDYTARLAEILARHGPHSVVGRARLRARDEVDGAIARTEARLAASGTRP